MMLTTFGTDPLAKLLGAWSVQLTPGAVLLRVTLSMLLSTAIGCERSGKRHAAGLRTFILVSLACTCAMLVDLYTGGGTAMPLLSAAAIIAVAILSSNSILYSSKSQIKGLTTSAGLWASGVLGLAVGAGFYTAALIGFAALLCCLALLPAIERYLKNRSNHFEIHIELKNRSDLQDFITTIRTLGLKIDDIEANPAYLNSGLSVYSVSLTVRHRDAAKYRSHADIVQALGTLECVYYAEEME